MIACWWRNRLLLVSACAPVVLGIAGCAKVDSKPRFVEAARLAGHQTGAPVDWTAPWDASLPAWDSSTVLGLDDAVELALRNNRELRADVEMIGVAHAELVQAGLLKNPVLNFMAMFPEGGGRSMLRSSGFPMQELQDLWLIPPRKEAAAAKLQETVLRVADRAVETAAEVKRSYARIQFAQRAIELIRANMAVVEQSRRLIQSQQAAGKATLVEVNVAQIRLLRLRSELMTMQADDDGGKRELLMLIGAAAATADWTVSPVDELHDDLAVPPSEEALLTRAREERLDLRAAEWSVAGAEHDLERMRREAWPDLALGLTFERAPMPRSQNQQLAGSVGNAAAQGLLQQTPPMQSAMPFSPKPREMDWTVGPMLEIELPIFDQNQAQIAMAVHEHRRRSAAYEAQRERVVSKVRENLVMHGQAVEQARFFREAIIPEVERSFQIVLESYRAGREDVTVLLQIQEDLIMTRLSALGFVRDASVTRADLERQVGGRLGSLEDATTPSTQKDTDLPAHSSGSHTEEK